MAAAIGAPGRAGLAGPYPGPRASALWGPLRASRAPRVCGRIQKRLRRPAVAIAAMAAPPFPAALAAAAGGGGTLFTVALAGVVMAALMALAASWRRSRSDLSKVPGPKQLPLVGNLSDLGHPQAHQTIVELANRFGSLVRWAGLISNPSALILVDANSTRVSSWLSASSARLALVSLHSSHAPGSSC